MDKLKHLKIDSRYDLNTAVLLINTLIDSGTIKQIWPSDCPFASNENVASIDVNGTLPDHIEMYFEAVASNKVFKLSVETYHGTGGELKEL